MLLPAERASLAGRSSSRGRQEGIGEGSYYQKWLSNSCLHVHNVAKDVQSSFLYLEFIYREDLRIESLIPPFPVLFYRLKNC